MKLLIHRGSHEIGGSCVEVQATSGSRILIDFEMPLQDSTGLDFNERYLEGKSLLNLIDEKLLFNIKGLYPDDIPSVDAVLISHSHKNHYGLLSYMYDFGDGWEHKIVVEKALPDNGEMKHPVCLAGKRNCPPEDCGGPYVYDEFLEALKNPDHLEHDLMTE